MKAKICFKPKASAGYALLMVMVIVSASLLILAATMNRTSTTATLNQRNNQFTTCQNAAEAATEKVIAQMRADYANGSDTAIANHLDLYRKLIPTSADDPYWANFQFSDGQGTSDRNYVQVISNRVYTALNSQYAGLSGWQTMYRVLSNVRQTGDRFDNVTTAIQQDVEFDTIPVFQFAIFYNSLLEFTWAAPLTVRGRTHANNNIYTGSSADLTFNDLVTSSGYISKTNWAGFTTRQMTGKITFNGSPGYSVNAPVLTLPIGTNNTSDAVREIIQIPPTNEPPTSAMGQQRYYNKAGMVLLVSNATVTVIIKNSPSDASPAIITSDTNTASLATNFPFLSLSKSFTDQRENKKVKPVEIDVGTFNTWASTNAYTSPTSPYTKHPDSNPLNIIYVADNRDVASGYLPAIRLTDGASVPTNPGSGGQSTGFTVATPDPLYVSGNYNCPNTHFLNTTNTTASVPASLISDALTILSPNWSDSLSAKTFTARVATPTTINAAIVTGVVYSGGSDGTSPFSGGVMNLPRLLESWGNGSVTLTMNTSIVNLFDSIIATAPFQNPGAYYYAPTRAFNFDPGLKDPTKLPPGTPVIGVVLRAKWASPPPNTVNYAGY